MLRKIATVIAYAGFIAGSLFLGTVTSLFLSVFIRDRRKKCLLFRKNVRSFCRFFIFFCHHTGVFRTAVSNAAELEKLRGSVVIANHPSLVDYVILISCLNPNTTTIFKQSLRRGFMKFVLHNLDYIPNSSSLEEINRHLENDANLLIFPEGSRTKRLPVKFSRGAAQIAVRNRMPVYMVFISCDTPGYLQHRFFSDSMTARTPGFLVTSIGTENVIPDIGTADRNTETGEKNVSSADPAGTVNTGAVNGSAGSEDETFGVAARHLTKRLEEMFNEKLDKSMNTPHECR